MPVAWRWPVAVLQSRPKRESYFVYLTSPTRGPVMNSRLFLGAVGFIAGATVILIATQPPLWMLLLLGSLALAVLYIVARLRSRYDPLDPRFGSCIPPISRPTGGADPASDNRSDV